VLTLALYGLLALVVIAIVFVLITRVIPPGEQIAPAVRDDPVWSLPSGRALNPREIAMIRLPVALRGYRFSETDQLLDRLADELHERDLEIARLRGGPLTDRPRFDDPVVFQRPESPVSLPPEPPEPPELLAPDDRA
jgi:hypothetical protein